MTNILHKRNPPLGALCGDTSRPATGPSMSDYWENVTCPACLRLKPDGAGGRTSFKHSYRGEGGDLDDVLG